MAAYVGAPVISAASGAVKLLAQRPSPSVAPTVRRTLASATPFSRAIAATSVWLPG